MTLDKLQKLNLKNKIIASLAVFVLIFFLLIYFIIIPAARDIKTMGREIEEQRIDLEKKYIKGNNLRQLAEDLKKIQPQLSLLDQIFINKDRELEFITAAENEANNSQVSQKINLSLPQTAENQKFKKGSLQFYTTGGFNEQLRYLLNLESLSYYINVKLLELAPAGGGETAKINSPADPTTQDQGRNINMFIDADTYWE